MWWALVVQKRGWLRHTQDGFEYLLFFWVAWGWSRLHFSTGSGSRQRHAPKIEIYFLSRTKVSMPWCLVTDATHIHINFLLKLLVLECYEPKPKCFTTALTLNTVHEKVLNTESLLVNVGLGTFNFSTRVVGIFNIELHHTNDYVCPNVQVTACKSVWPAYCIL